jgi:hypothetical protein
VDVAQPQPAIEHVAAGPALVPVLAPDQEIRIEHDGEGDLQPLDGLARHGGVAAERVTGRVDPDHAQPGVGVALVPGLQVGERADRVDPRGVHELDDNRPPELLVHAQERGADPVQAGRELGGDDVGFGGRTHE